MRKAQLLFVLPFLLAATQAQATLVELGTATGDINVHFNSNTGLGETAANVSYVQASFGPGNSNGMAFQFDDTDLGGFNWNSIFSGQPVGSSQFGFDLVSLFPSYAGVDAVPAMNFYDNVNNTPGGATVTPASPPNPGAFAINDYKGAGSGPQNAGSSPTNSIFRGVGGNLTTANLTQTGTEFWLEIGGYFLTDGSIHWYNPATPHTDLTAWGLDDRIYFAGNFHYDSAGESSTNLVDAYSGSMTLYFDTLTPVPEPATLSLMGMGLAGLALRRKFSKRA